MPPYTNSFNSYSSAEVRKCQEMRNYYLFQDNADKYSRWVSGQRKTSKLALSKKKELDCCRTVTEESLEKCMLIYAETGITPHISHHRMLSTCWWKQSYWKMKRGSSNQLHLYSTSLALVAS